MGYKDKGVLLLLSFKTNMFFENLVDLKLLESIHIVNFSSIIFKELFFEFDLNQLFGVLS